MNRVETITQYNELIKKYLKKNILTNQYELPQSLHPWIEDGKISYEEFEFGIIWFRQQSNVIKVTYHFREIPTYTEELLCFNIVDMPFILELLYTHDDSMSQGIKDFFLQCGFGEYISRKRRVYKIIEQNNQEVSQSAGDKTITNDKLSYEELSFEKLSFANLSDIKCIEGWLIENFDPYLSCIPSLQQLEEQIKNKNYICAYNALNQLMGFIHVEYRRGVVFIWHVVVGEAFRGQGVISRLLNDVVTYSKHQGADRIQLWVRDDNKVAQHVYEKFGFIEDNYASFGMLK